jgi:hypothetical protein
MTSEASTVIASMLLMMERICEYGCGYSTFSGEKEEWSMNSGLVLRFINEATGMYRDANAVSKRASRENR